MRKIISVFLCFVMLFAISACGKESKVDNSVDMNIELKPSTASEDILMFENPDRGFRLEAYCGVGATSDPSVNLKQWNPKFEAAANSIKEGIWAKPKLVQTYVYLTDYKDTKTLPDHVF